MDHEQNGAKIRAEIAKARHWADEIHAQHPETTNVLYDVQLVHLEHLPNELISRIFCHCDHDFGQRHGYRGTKGGASRAIEGSHVPYFTMLKYKTDDQYGSASVENHIKLAKRVNRAGFRCPRGIMARLDVVAFYTAEALKLINLILVELDEEQ